jgi:molecular chaperone DnaK (HSP70)
LDCSLPSLHNVLFLIRDWNPKAKGFGYGLKNGFKYIQNLSHNENLNCFLMCSPEFNSDLNEINLALLNNQFIIHLKNLMDLKLMNKDELKGRLKSKGNECLNVDEMIDLFKVIVEKLNKEKFNLYQNEEEKNCESSDFDEPDGNQLEESISDKHEDEASSNESKQENIDDIGEKISSDFNAAKSCRESYNENMGAIQISPEGLKDTIPVHDCTIASNVIEIEVNSFPLFKNERNIEIDSKYNSVRDNSYLNDNEEYNKDTNQFSEHKKWKIQPSGIEINHSNSIDSETESMLTNKLINQNYDNNLSQSQQNYENTNFLQNKDDFEKKEQSKNDTEIKLKGLVEKLSSEYLKDLEIELKKIDIINHNDLDLYHEKIYQYIKRNFEEVEKNEPLMNEVYIENKKLLTETIENKFRIYKKAIENFQNLLSESLIFYQHQIECSLKSHIIENYNICLNEISKIKKIFEECKEKTLEHYKRGSEKIETSGFEKLYLNKLEDGLLKIKITYETILKYFWDNESNRKRKFSDQVYISETELKNFFNDEKQIIKYAIEKLNNDKLLEYVVLIMETAFSTFEQKNKKIGECELEMTENAIGLSLELYRECFELKMRSGLFTPTQVEYFLNKLLSHTKKSLFEACNFNKDQSILIAKCNSDVEMRVKGLRESMLLKYQQKFDAAIKQLDKIKSKSIRAYCNAMETKLSDSHPLKKKEFEDFHYETLKKASEIVNKSAYFFEQEFDVKFAKSLLLDTNSQIRDNINLEKIEFAKENKKNCSKGATLAIYLGQQFITAAVYRNGVQIIVDKYGRKNRPNSLALENGLLFGSEAKNYLENTRLSPRFKNFDIKRLLGIDIRCISEEELSCFPFIFLRDKLSVFVFHDDLLLYLSIEALLALLILEIKSEAETQIGGVVTNLVLTYPTCYNIVKKNALKNAIEISEIEGDFDIISEISAAAVGYATEMRIDQKHDVLFVIVNNYEFDVAVCEVTKNEIKYKALFNETLDTTDARNKKAISKISFNIRKEHKDINKCKARILFKASVDNVLCKSKVKKEKINSWIISGTSLLTPNIKKWIGKYFCTKPELILNQEDIIINGCTFFGEMVSHKKDCIDISEVTTHAISVTLEKSNSQKSFPNIIKKNEALPKKCLLTNNFLKLVDLPIKISVFQDEQLISIHSIESLDQLNDIPKNLVKHKLFLTTDYFGNVELMSIINNKNDKSKISLEFKVIKTGLTEDEINCERRKLKLLKQKIEEKICLDNDKLLADKLVSELTKFCSNAKVEIENNREIRSIIKKGLLKVLNETLQFIKINDQDLAAINNRKQILIKQLENYEFNSDLLNTLLH